VRHRPQPALGLIDAVWLDAGGVLVLPDPTVLGPLLAPYGADASIERHRRAHYAAMAAKSLAAADEFDWREYDLAYLNSLGVGGDVDVDVDVDEAVTVLGRTRNPHLWRWPVAESVAAVAALHAAGVPLGVVSNASGQIEGVLRRARICQVGDGDATPVRCVVDSHVVGVAKPDPRIFDFAMPFFDGIDRSRIAYVGDSVTMDIGAATAAGLLPILLDPYDDHAGAPFARITSLSELLSPPTRAGGRSP
jgi:putative hydrolase of the HAD superfamily